MRFEDSFSAAVPVAKVWRLFEDEGERVGYCIPGIDSVEVLGEDRYRIEVTQSAGAVSVTFDIIAEIKNKQPLDSLEIAARGKSVAGAVGTLTADAVVTMSEDGGVTTVNLDARIILNGPLASFGHKVVSIKTAEVTAGFARNLKDALTGGQAI